MNNIVSRTEALSMCNDSMAATIGKLDILAKQQVYCGGHYMYLSYFLSFPSVPGTSSSILVPILIIILFAQILSPLLIGISAAAEETVANLHSDNFGRGAQEADTGSMLTIEDCISVRSGCGDIILQSGVCIYLMN